METAGPSDYSSDHSLNRVDEESLKPDISCDVSRQNSSDAVPTRIMSTITPARDANQQVPRLPPGVRVVRSSPSSASTSGQRVSSHQVRPALGTGASHPGHMVNSGASSGPVAIRSAPVRTVVGSGAGLRVMQQGGRTLIAVPSGSRLEATLTSVAARATPVELSTSGSGPSLAVLDVNRSRSQPKHDFGASVSSAPTSIQGRCENVQNGNSVSPGVIDGSECISPLDDSSASTSPQTSLSPGSVVGEKQKPLEHTRISSSGMVTRRMTRHSVLPNSEGSIDEESFAATCRHNPASSVRRRGAKRPRFSLSTGDLVRAQYILPADQLPRRSSVPREENPLSITEQSRLSRRPIVVHSSGVEFAIPLSLEAHPMKLDDTGPENPSEDILRDDDGLPYCYLCHSVLKTWQGYEYHIMAVHLKYRPYRCMYCMKEYFYTEEEGLSHVRSQHHGKTVTLLREYHDDKEKQLEDAFCALYVAVREGPNFTAERAAAIEKTAYVHLQKFKRMRMKVPEFATRAKSVRDFASQTFASMSSPHTMIPAIKFAEPRHQFEHLQHHLEPLQHPEIGVPMKSMEIEHPDAQQRYVRMSNGELAQINEQYVIAEDDEGPVGEYIEVDYVDEIIDDAEGHERDSQEVVLEHLPHADDHHGLQHQY